MTDVRVNVISGLETSIGLTKGYTTEGISAGKLKAGEEKTVKIPVRVAKNFAPGLYEIQFAATYKDKDKAEKTSETMTMYVKGPAEKEEEKKEEPVKLYNVSIGNVSQSPENPKAGETVTVSFDVINEGNTAITNVKVAGTGLSSTGFEPVNSDPYKSVGSIAAGSRKNVTMTFKVGKDIPQGFNTLNITCEYVDESGTSLTESAGLYILDVVNEREENNEQKTSRPKLIISSYSADPVYDEDDLSESGTDPSIV